MQCLVQKAWLDMYTSTNHFPFFPKPWTHLKSSASERSMTELQDKSSFFFLFFSCFISASLEQNLEDNIQSIQYLVILSSPLTGNTFNKAFLPHFQPIFLYLLKINIFPNFKIFSSPKFSSKTNIPSGPLGTLRNFYYFYFMKILHLVCWCISR